MNLSYTEENYLKSIFQLVQKDGNENTSTNAIAENLGIKPATVTSMLKKLRDKELIFYEKYGKTGLTKIGNKIALEVIRKHRLWEVFLYEKLDFTWDEVHEIAEQLEHIQSATLINRLDAFLGFPQKDPHGDPIPDIHGQLKHISKTLLSDAITGKEYRVIAVKDSSTEFLQDLMHLKITLDTKIKVLKKMEFDQSLQLLINQDTEIIVSAIFSKNLIIE